MDTEPDISGQDNRLNRGEEEEEGGEEEDPPSLNDQLDRFRQQWREELYTRKRSNSSTDLAERASLEEQAKQCFMTGSKLEQQGSLYEAIQFYRHAMKLVPDIENLIKLDFIGHSPRERQISESSVESYDGELLDPELQDLQSKFQDIQLEENGWCLPQYQQRSCHISVLPTEVMIYILKWVVSSQLDLKSLENVSMVCRGFYVFARDDELWRLACLRIWGNNTGKVKKYGTWRNMYVERPHLQYTGCYISKMVYHRQGEQTLEQSYTPWHTVEYFRYIRFFTEGKIFMITSAEEPEQTIPKLRNPNLELPGLLKGVYKISGDRVTAVMKRKRPKETNTMKYKRNKNQINKNESSQTFHLDMEIMNAGKRKGHKLTWMSYSVRTLYKSTGEETVADFDLNDKSYPPLIFSRVKSFSQNTDAPLGI